MKSLKKILDLIKFIHVKNLCLFYHYLGIERKAKQVCEIRCSESQSVSIGDLILQILDQKSIFNIFLKGLLRARFDMKISGLYALLENNWKNYQNELKAVS